MTTNTTFQRNAAITKAERVRDILSESTVGTGAVPVRTVSAQYVSPRALSPRDDSWGAPLGSDAPRGDAAAAHGSGRKT